VQEEVPPGFLYVDTGISGGAGTGAGRPAQPAYPAREESAEREAESPAGTPLAAPAPFPPRPSASAMTIDEAIRLATELQEGGEHGAPRANGREGRSAVAS
jgi:hypothetical protein